jgi:LacI family transcriptional regulator
VKRITILDVANRAGLSVGTVSRVLNDKPVSRKALDAVTQAIEELGYAPNAVAQSMRTQTTRAIGLVVNDISNPLFSGIARSLDEVLHASGYSLLIANTDNDPRREQLIIDSLKQRRIDGLAIAVSDETNDRTTKLLRSVEFPVVLLDRELEIPADKVCDDHSKGMKKAVRYLFDLGHRDIALITGGNDVRPGRERAQGFLEAFREGGIAIEEGRLRQGRLDSSFGYEEACVLLKETPRPTALIAGGNQILAGVLRALRQLDIRIPTDLSLISCDEIDLTALMNPPITVITREIRRIGTITAELLLRRIAGQPTDEYSRQIVPTELLVRESCARLG